MSTKRIASFYESVYVTNNRKLRWTFNVSWKRRANKDERGARLEFLRLADAIAREAEMVRKEMKREP